MGGKSTYLKMVPLLQVTYVLLHIPNALNLLTCGLDRSKMFRLITYFVKAPSKYVEMQQLSKSFSKSTLSNSVKAHSKCVEMQQL